MVHFVLILVGLLFFVGTHKNAKKGLEQNNTNILYHQSLITERQGINQNGQAALAGYQKSAMQGCSKAQFSLGQIYYEGRGVVSNEKEAAKWYQKAAENDHAIAQFYLGMMYELGIGVPQNQNEAAKWYLKATEQDNAAAQFRLSQMYS